MWWQVHLSTSQRNYFWCWRSHVIFSDCKEIQFHSDSKLQSAKGSKYKYLMHFNSYYSWIVQIHWITGTCKLWIHVHHRTVLHYFCMLDKIRAVTPLKFEPIIGPIPNGKKLQIFPIHDKLLWQPWKLNWNLVQTFA